MLLIICHIFVHRIVMVLGNFKLISAQFRINIFSLYKTKNVGIAGY